MRSPTRTSAKRGCTAAGDITSGMFDDLWNREKHVLPAFEVPKKLAA